MAKAATILVPGLKVAVPLRPESLPRDLVPMDGPAGEPVLDLALEGGTLTARARLNGKNYRRMLKQIDEHGAGNVAVVLSTKAGHSSSGRPPFLRVTSAAAVSSFDPSVGLVALPRRVLRDGRRGRPHLQASAGPKGGPSRPSGPGLDSRGPDPFK